MNWLSRLALLLMIIGALNWLLVGFSMGLAAAVFGGETMRASSMLAVIVHLWLAGLLQPDLPVWG